MRNPLLLLGFGLLVASALPAQSSPSLSPAQRRATLLDASRPFWKAHAPDTVVADVETSKGVFTLELVRAWAPHGVDRFYNLARAGYYDDSRFYRVVYGFVAQFGLAGDPAIARAWSRRTIPADAPREHNVRGTVAFAQSKPGDRTTHLFVNLRDNPELDTLRFVPVGRVREGMQVADSLETMYGEFPSADKPFGDPARLYGEANRYLDKQFPKLDRIVKVTIRP